MRVLVVHAHPRHDSYGHALFEAACLGLLEGGHVVDQADLYADGFAPAMSLAERQAYHSDQPIVHALTERYAASVKAADALVFVYPTWWSTMPAMLKGWFDKVLLPGVAFRFDENHKVRPDMHHIREVIGVSTYGSPRLHQWFFNDNGRRIITRALRLNTGWRTRVEWLGLYAIDSSTDEERTVFLHRVRDRMRAL